MPRASSSSEAPRLPKEHRRTVRVATVLTPELQAVLPARTQVQAQVLRWWYHRKAPQATPWLFPRARSSSPLSPPNPSTPSFTGLWWSPMTRATPLDTPGVNGDRVLTSCPSPGHFVSVPVGYAPKSPEHGILPAQVVNIQPLLPRPCSITNGRVNLAYFRVDGYFAPFCVDEAGNPCFDALCHAIYPMSFVSTEFNRHAGITGQNWITQVLGRLKAMGCVVRAEGKAVATLEADVLERSRKMEREYDPDLREWETVVVDV
ncbi:hypothetical protein EIP91_011597 [Steccherinum ochraceum]|uniref:Uncharacterized protein n=1 Tax=Steccherinum ochraceum TaxID=92696 RepID=A0A4R0RM16_9APHY|nr:hypothetical protein EIP91_011597 [Steccherinum ochraceum]